VSLALKVVMQIYGDFVDVILLHQGIRRKRTTKDIIMIHIVLVRICGISPNKTFSVEQ